MPILTSFETLHAASADLPEVPFTPYNPDVKIQLLRIDPVRGQTCMVLVAPPSTGLGIHKHYGSVIVYTLSGGWRYLEHDWVARAGDFVYETAGSWHTFVSEPGESTRAFVIVEGALEFLDADGRRIGIEDWQTMYQRYLDHCETTGITARDLSHFLEHLPTPTRSTFASRTSGAGSFRTA